MDVWQIRFLGVPCAFQGDRQARLRSKETWAVLASLIVPALLRGESPSPVSRETLSDRFWVDSRTLDTRVHLRQCLASLRDAFGAERLLADRHDVQIAPDGFVTDLERALSAYRKAQSAVPLEERLHWLMEAEAEIRGEFFEGWTPDTEEAQIWLIHLHAEVQSRLLAILLSLAQTLEEVGNLNGAFDIVRRTLQFQPGHTGARKLAWKLAVATGQQDVVQALEQTQSFLDALAKLPHQGIKTLTLRDGRLFQSLFEAEFNSLPPGLRTALQRLSILPSPFSAALAHAACQVPLPALTALAKSPLLEIRKEQFFLPETVRECARKLLPTATRQRLQRRQAVCCITWLIGMHFQSDALLPLFASLEEANPFLNWAMEWALAQTTSSEHMAFVNLMRYYELIENMDPAIAYFRQLRQNETLPDALRIEAGLNAAYALMQKARHIQAVEEMEAVLPLALSLVSPDWLVALFGSLMMACHYAGNSEQAVSYASRLLSEFRPNLDPLGETVILRFLGEIYTHLGDFILALRYCKEALALRRERNLPAIQIADALYWTAKCLFRLEHWEETAARLEEALSLWQQAQDITGIGFCLRLMGQLRGKEGRYAEAQVLLEHAILLHAKTGIEVNRMAAVEVLGDLLRASQREAEAQTLYQECLEFYTAKALQSGIARLRAKRE